MRIRCWQFFSIIPLAAGLISGCTGGQVVEGYSVATGGYAHRGQEVMVLHRCGSCHMIPGVRDADGVFGPPLVYFSQRTLIAGEFPNTPTYLVDWIKSPKSMKPRTSMPDLGLSEQQSRDVAAYLYTLR